jgi:hypothetical protein
MHGSGSPHPRRRVEGSWALDADGLRRPIRAGSEGFLAVTMRGGLAREELAYLIRNDGDGFVLDTWASATPSASPMRFRLALVPLRFGGARTYLRCPGLAPWLPCGRRVRTLYWPLTDTRGFACRVCYNLAYRSSQQRSRSIADWRAAVERPSPPLASVGAAWRRYRRLEAAAALAQAPDDRRPSSPRPSA